MGSTHKVSTCDQYESGSADEFSRIAHDHHTRRASSLGLHRLKFSSTAQPMKELLIVELFHYSSLLVNPASLTS